MNQNLSELKRELCSVEEQLEHQKLKRTILLVLFHSVIAGIVLFCFGKPTSILDALALIGSSLFLGAVSFIITTVLFVLTTQWTTNIESLERRKEHLKHQIEKQEEY